MLTNFSILAPGAINWANRTVSTLDMPANGEPLTLHEALAGRRLSRNAGVIVLNIILSVVQLSSYATGYDGSMMSV